MELHNILKRRLEELGMSRAELARKVAPHVSQRSVYAFVDGENQKLNLESFQHILAALGLSMNIVTSDGENVGHRQQVAQLRADIAHLAKALENSKQECERLRSKDPFDSFPIDDIV